MFTSSFINVDKAQMLPNKVLIEYFKQNEEVHYGSLSLKVQAHNYQSSDSTSTGKGRHLERSGKVIRICDQLKTFQMFNYGGGEERRRNWNWHTNVEVKEGQWVWFASSVFDNAQKFNVDGKNYMVADYHQLYMSEEKPLNGYLLCEKVKKPPRSKIIYEPKKQYYSNIYKVYKKASPIEYIEHYQDILDFIEEGDYIRTRFNFPYPLLEEPGHNFFSDKELHIFQSKEIEAKIEFHEQQ